MIKIKESGEKMVLLNDYAPDLIIDLAHKKYNDNRAYLRKTLVDKIEQAREDLPEKFDFVINSAYRSPTLQRIIFEKQLKINKDRYPNWAEEKISKLTNRYVAPWKGPNISAHSTGGAVDIQLWDNRRNSRAKIKSTKLSLQENAKTHQPKLPVNIRSNRNIMIEVLASQDLYNYKYEFWHWTYGDRTWAMSKGKDVAIYGPIYDIDNYTN